MSSFGLRLRKCFEETGQLCVGIDPSSAQLHSWSLPDSAQGAKEFALAILDASVGRVGIVKPQVAFFEQYGSEGFRALEEILERAKSEGFLVIADAKRGDIGSTMSGYAKAWLSKDAPFFADALTVSPYLGVEYFGETVGSALAAEKGVFILAATSNPEALEIQSARTTTGTVAQAVVQYAASLNADELGSVGVVIGATVALGDLGISAANLENTPILMPGFGQQGVSLLQTGERFGDLKKSLICNVSRSIAGSAKDGLVERIETAKDELRLGLAS